MAQFSGHRAGEKKICEVPLAEDTFDVATHKIQDQHVTKKMKRPGMKKDRGHELPGIGVVNAVPAESEVIRDKTGLKSIEAALRDENGNVDSDDCQQN